MAAGDATASWPVWGHGAAVAGLRRAVTSERVRHAYVFAGPDGLGKSLVARAFAAATACESSERVDPSVPCGRCRACRRIARGTHPDVQTWSLATQAATDTGSGKNATLTIETVRQLSASTALRPLEAPRRFVILDDAEAMQRPAQEALLKTLEEPPPAVTIVLLATDADALLPTVRSRCQTVALGPVGTSTIAAGLVAMGVDTDLAREAAALANGRPGWAMRAVTDPSLLDDRRQAVQRAVAWIGSPVGERMVTAAILGESFGKKRHEVFSELEALQSVWRDAMLTGAGAGRYTVHGSERAEIATATAGIGAGEAARALAAVRRCVADLEANVRPRLALEGMVLEWPMAEVGR